jgi:ring-1,2-phenylacetyl-CoA epoxidase subunit PaaD
VSASSTASSTTSASDFSQARAWAVAAAVPDPEIPVVTVADLGILRSVALVDGVAVAKVSPTYTGCPAVLAIEMAIEAALLGAGFEARIERVISPAWSTDWISEEGREKLRAYGIAPPEKTKHSVRALFDTQPVACPRCGSDHTERLSEFGATPCKAMHRCLACREPFEAFKCL